VRRLPQGALAGLVTGLAAWPKAKRRRRSPPLVCPRPRAAATARAGLPALALAGRPAKLFILPVAKAGFLISAVSLLAKLGLCPLLGGLSKTVLCPACSTRWRAGWPAAALLGRLSARCAALLACGPAGAGFATGPLLLWAFAAWFVVI